MSDIQIRPTQTDPASLNAHLRLFQNCFPDARVYTVEYLEWLYKDNPAGSVVGYDAWDGNTLAATYVTIPAPIVQPEGERRALLSLNTATHEDYRGKGLFTRLAENTYKLAQDNGFEVVFGVANANSVGGFTRKLGFQDVGGLSARIGCGKIGVSPKIDQSSLEFYRCWDRPLLEWRIRNPSNPLSVSMSEKGMTAVGATHVLPVRAFAFVPSNLLKGAPPIESSRRQVWRPFNIALGLWGGQSVGGFNIELPRQLRPSPLRLIYRDLKDQDRKIDSARCNMTFIDFDGF